MFANSDAGFFSLGVPSLSKCDDLGLNLLARLGEGGIIDDQASSPFSLFSRHR
jgi:hypothetical protein